MMRIFLMLMILLLTVPAVAAEDTSPQRDGTPSQWAIVALEDIFTYSYNEQSPHFLRMKESYFSEQGWNQFQAALKKARIEQAVLSSEYFVFGIAQKADLIRVVQEKYEGDSVYSEIIIPFYLTYSEPEAGLNRKKMNSLLIKLAIKGIKDPVRKYRTHVGSLPSYNYKIESYQIQAGQ